MELEGTNNVYFDSDSSYNFRYFALIKAKKIPKEQGLPVITGVGAVVMIILGVKLKLKYIMKNDKGNTVCETCSAHCFLDEKGIPIRLNKEYPFFNNALIECCSF